jgi:nucleotide-binding universal stress UspA family protein
MKRIVVGVDGSPGSRLALEWAYAEATQRGAALDVVAAWSHPPVPVTPEALAWSQKLGDLSPATKEMVDEMLQQVIGDRTDVDVETTIVEGSPAAVLLDEAEDAEMLVVGSRGLGGFRSLLLGSVSQQCAQHGTCPVVIVPPAAPAD